MEVTGAEFREPKSGPNKGKLCIIIPGSIRSTKLMRDELDAFRAKQVAQA